jgi:hypothetical protein
LWNFWGARLGEEKRPPSDRFPLSEPAGRVWEVERRRRTGQKFQQVSGGTIFQPHQIFGVNFGTALRIGVERIEEIF